MAEFSVDLQAPQGAGASPLSPVQSQPNPLFGFVENVVEGFGKLAAQGRKEQAEAAKQATLGEYAQKLSAIEDAQITGQWDSKRVNLERRKLHSQFIASNPQYVKEIKEINSSFLEGGGVKEALEEEQAQQDRRRNILNDAAKNGLVAPKGAGPEVEEAIIAAQISNQRFDDELRRMQQVQSLRRGAKEEDRADLAARQSAEADVLLTEHGNKNLDAFSGIVQAGVQQAWSGRDVSDIILNAQQFMTGVRQTVNIIARNNPEKANAYLKMYEEQMDILKNAPNASREETSNLLKQTLEKRALMMVMKDDEALNLASTLKLGFNIQNYDSNARIVADRLVKFSVKGNSSGSMELASDGNKMGVAVKAFDTSYGQEVDAEGKKQKANLASGILRSMALSTNVSTMDSTQFNEATNFLASTGFKELWTSGQISTEDVAGAERAYQRLYAQPVSLAIQNKLTQDKYTPRPRFGVEQPTARAGGPANPMLQSPRAVSPEPRPYSDFVEYQMIGETLTARPKIVDGHPLDVQDSQRIAEDLRATTEYLNKMVTIGTTLTRSPTKQAFWEMNKHTILPDIYPDPQKVKAGQVYEMEGKKFKYKGGYPWKSKDQWEEISDENSKPDYGNRPDGSKKGTGYLGELKVPGTNAVATEYSVGVNIGGKEMDIPTLVPTLSEEQKKRLLKAISNNESPPEDIIRTAVEHAKKRLKENKSVFAD